MSFGGRIFHVTLSDTKSWLVPSNCCLTVLNLRSLKDQHLETYKCLIQDTLEMADQGAISAHVSAKFELNDINKAIEYIEAKKCTGKVLIKID